jgi:Rieske Fe-S protein
MRDLSRRAVLAGACGTCAATVAGCATLVTGRAAPVPPTPALEPAPDAPAPSAAPTAAAGNGKLGAAADIPVGGGKIFAERNVVVSQPEEGTFVGFSATCTHQGCAVTTITGNTINCPCHGSKFSLADGTVVNGPATSPLAKKTVKVTGGQLTVT